MKIVSVWALLIAVLLIGGCSSGESFFRAGYDFSALDKVAIVAIEGAVKSEPARNQIADFFAMELLKKGYAPVRRSQVKALLKEEELELTDLTTAEGATITGEILDVPVVLVADIPHFGREISMTATMIDVKDGSVLWMGRGSGKTGGTLAAIFGFFSGDDDGSAVSGKEAEMLGGIPDEVLGGVTGGVLSLQEAKEARKVVKRMCRSLPLKPASKL
jgi:hypothetical protein